MIYFVDLRQETCTVERPQNMTFPEVHSQYFILLFIENILGVLIG